MKLFVSFAAVVLSLSIFQQAEAAVDIYISKFDEQVINTAYAGSGLTFLTDTFGTTSGNRGNFTSFTGATTNIAYTGTGSPRIIANDQFGGYQDGNYLGVIAGATVTATFAAPVSYFGLHISALDANNNLKIYSGTTLLVDFTASVLTALLPNNPTSTVRAINGSLYNTNQYYGQPTSNLNANEPYAFLSFFGTAGTTISRVVLTQTNSAIFETDNYTIRTAATTPAQSLVLVPEPDTAGAIALGGTVLATAVFVRRRNRL